MTRSRRALRREDLGSSPQAAIRAVLDVFRDHGWRDPGTAALQAVDALERTSRGLTSAGLTAALPADFFDRNNTAKTAVRQAFDELVERRSPATETRQTDGTVPARRP